MHGWQREHTNGPKRGLIISNGSNGCSWHLKKEAKQKPETQEETRGSLKTSISCETSFNFDTLTAITCTDDPRAPRVQATPKPRVQPTPRPFL